MQFISKCYINIQTKRIARNFCRGHLVGILAKIKQVEARAKQEKLYKSGCEPVENSYEPNLKAVEKRSKIVLNPRQSRENVETLKKHPCQPLRKTIYSGLARAN